METKLIKVNDNYSIKQNGEYVAFANEDFTGYVPQEFRDNLIGVLSKQNCDDIFGVVDVNSEVEDIVKTICPDDRGKDVIYGTGMAVGIQCFNKAMELNKDKVFTLEDMRKAISMARKGSQERLHDGYGNFTQPIFVLNNTSSDEIIQSLQQTEWDVEIVMGDPIGIGDKYTPDTKPKLDENGCLILKRIR
jgi:hypothetical protein